MKNIPLIPISGRSANLVAHHWWPLLGKGYDKDLRAESIK